MKLTAKHYLANSKVFVKSVPRAKFPYFSPRKNVSHAANLWYWNNVGEKHWYLASGNRQYTDKQQHSLLSICLVSLMLPVWVIESAFSVIWPRISSSKTSEFHLLIWGQNGKVNGRWCYC
ncbi:hypothetical protein BaRGS_00036855 [Batillaria attramentaria]|uniref:Uncharacterized protein n=1 Tax=Batillaria attramentaria TaxID=370345 RepID=A0ABD0JAG3_9CAEN